MGVRDMVLTDCLALMLLCCLREINILQAVFSTIYQPTQSRSPIMAKHLLQRTSSIFKGSPGLESLEKGTLAPRTTRIDADALSKGGDASAPSVAHSIMREREQDVHHLWRR